MKTRILMIAALAAGVSAAETGGREAFLKQQAYAEMQRVSSQIDTLQTNFDHLESRVGRLEGGSSTRSLEVEIEALKASVAELRRELANQRGEIVKDLSGRLAKMQPKEPPPPKQIVVQGPTGTYVVQSGDNLYFIAQAFKTTVSKLREMNGLKSDNLKIGQKLVVPQVKE